jgi:hypothetical protein
MIQSGVKSKQRPRLAWTRDRLLRERAIALGQAIDKVVVIHILRSHVV